MSANTRRTFLKQAAATTASAFYLTKHAWSSALPSGSSVRGWVTGRGRYFADMPTPSWRDDQQHAKADIEVDASQHFQSVLGFGAAFTDASCYLLSQLPTQKRAQLLSEFVGPNGLAMSMGRTCIGSSDYSRDAYSFDDTTTPDPELKSFSVAHDQAYILPVLREAQQINPEMFYFSTPWSPPGWMKAGGSLLGGSMRNHYFSSYANYFVKFLQAYQAAGVKVRAVTSQNEVDTDQDGRMPAALWGQEYETGFIKGFLGPALRQAGLDTKIWILDHNYNLAGRAMDELSEPDVFKYVDGVAWHGYLGDPSAMTRVHDAFPSMHAYWTEGGPDLTDPAYTADCAKWACTFAAILKNWARCIVSWNLVLDENGSPNIGPFHCGGLVTLNSKTGVLTRSGQYWAFAHYSKMIQRGATVLASKGTQSGIEHAAFLNPDGSYVLVIGNQGDERQVVCRAGGKTLEVNLPRNGAVTLTWSDI
jgi:glucosylceramidase